MSPPPPPRPCGAGRGDDSGLWGTGPRSCSENPEPRGGDSQPYGGMRCRPPSAGSTGAAQEAPGKARPPRCLVGTPGTPSCPRYGPEPYVGDAGTSWGLRGRLGVVPEPPPMDTGKWSSPLGTSSGPPSLPLGLSCGLMGTWGDPPSPPQTLPPFPPHDPPGVPVPSPCCGAAGPSPGGTGGGRPSLRKGPAGGMEGSCGPPAHPRGRAGGGEASLPLTC